MFKNKKFLYAALALSLAVNFVIIGAAGSAAWHWKSARNGGNWLENRLDRVENRVTKRLEGEDRELARTIFAERRPDLRAALKEIRAARRDFRAALGETSPDPAALTAALDRSQAAIRSINDNVHGGMRDMAQGLSPEARQRISKRMKRYHDRNENQPR